jgi:hypothetical protein
MTPRIAPQSPAVGGALGLQKPVSEAVPLASPGREAGRPSSGRPRLRAEESPSVPIAGSVRGLSEPLRAVLAAAARGEAVLPGAEAAVKAASKNELQIARKTLLGALSPGQRALLKGHPLTQGPATGEGLLRLMVIAAATRDLDGQALLSSVKNPAELLTRLPTKVMTEPSQEWVPSLEQWRAAGEEALTMAIPRRIDDSDLEYLKRMARSGLAHLELTGASLAIQAEYRERILAAYRAPSGPSAEEVEALNRIFDEFRQNTGRGIDHREPPLRPALAALALELDSRPFTVPADPARMLETMAAFERAGRNLFLHIHDGA